MKSGERSEQHTPGPRSCLNANTNGKVHIFSALTLEGVNCKRCLAWMAKHGWTTELSWRTCKPTQSSDEEDKR